MNPQELKEVFELFDKDSNGSVSARELGAILRSLGQSPSDADLVDMVRYMKDVYEWTVGNRRTRGAVEGGALNGAANDAVVSLEMFSNLVGAKVREVEMEEELKAALQVFELPNRPGCIQLSSLRIAVTSWGDRLSSDEVEELLKDADVADDGTIVIEDFIRSIMAR